ncbi:hypothetical protein HDU91_005131 [Kappamyces sp. JEL0680]|nr:hypothetical protein HDU91_005131 [Kappamyces sp. JEL0680]
MAAKEAKEQSKWENTDDKFTTGGNLQDRKPPHAIVWVDPQDEKAKYWWPALVIPASLFHLMDPSVTLPTAQSTELLVCYFEDASFSVVPASDTMAFSPFSHPFQDWSNHQSFRSDRGVMLAMQYWQSHILPKHITFLSQQGGADQDDDDGNTAVSPISDLGHPSHSSAADHKRKRDAGSSQKRKTVKLSNRPDSPAHPAADGKEAGEPGVGLDAVTGPGSGLPSPLRSASSHDDQSNTPSPPLNLATPSRTLVDTPKAVSFPGLNAPMVDKRKKWLAKYAASLDPQPSLAPSH